MVLIGVHKRAVDATATVHIYLQRNVIAELIRSVFEGREGRGSLHILSYITEAVLRILPSLEMVPSSLVQEPETGGGWRTVNCHSQHQFGRSYKYPLDRNATRPMWVARPPCTTTT